MINPFKIKINKRYTLNNKTVIVESFTRKKVVYYYLVEWQKTQPIRPILVESGMIWFIFNAKKYKFK